MRKYLSIPNKYYSEIEKGKTAVFVHLYYKDTLDMYLNYLKRIPDEFDLYISYSDDNIVSYLKDCMSDRENVFFIQKENRGRDISALLVAFRPHISKYEYYCFLHDKKAKEPKFAMYVDAWVKNMWDSMLLETNYIRGIINAFETDNSLGILLPTYAFGPNINLASSDLWSANYENTCNLAEKLGLKIQIKRDLAPMSIGTVFWTRAECLRKLFENNWEYSDFDEEPLNEDGTISHAIERIFDYVAKDAGFQAKFVLSEEMMNERLAYSQDIINQSMKILKNEFAIFNGEQLSDFYIERDKIEQFIAKNKRTFIYGTGMYGNACSNYVSDIAGFIETVPTKTYFKGKPVYDVDSIKLNENDGVIIATSLKNAEEIENSLKAIGIKNYIIFKHNKMER